MRILIGGLVALLLLFQIQLWTGKGGLPAVWQLQDAASEQRAENEQLEQRNRALEADVDDLKDGLGAIEERARDELGMIRDDEVFYQVSDE
ncbi:cell division protein FtsB [Aquisalimonas asiatica]|uniref:Cell division protein FtsB n=1 Tax=Aquisalimonas asiatica TaxID=406100 RepID=A0A1H8QJ10_9GAMM|nr:cell division protein FtsB [Aquisalimonas asiatica]SEO53981.1 cell division protein FtsB [Aquisalimonas asiatica]